ncbi:MAG TPA: hypothetical protein DHW82_08450 [Spirochaetia bacterium]|nr:MAG: hypothetical protein A2Y41_13105 [Spirochaetes bacterium GWB1_36_13]HCL57019.1 hypothetical protein [Spirochaetia bacterium]
MLKIQIQNKSFHNFTLKGFQFSLRKGEILALAGMNGSGKTTLLKTIAGIDPDFDGKILFRGQPLHLNDVEYIPPSISPSLSILTRFFLEISLEKIKVTVEDRERIHKIASFLKISNLMDKDLKNLSSGEMTKILLAKALIRKKPVLLWDEPTSFLDLKYKNYLLQILKKIKKKRILIITTHDYHWAKKIADSFMGIKNGEPVFLDSLLNKENLKKILI